jgi:hypothetical protein
MKKLLILLALTLGAASFASASDPIPDCIICPKG